MAYIDYNYYIGAFGGSLIPCAEFEYLAAASSDILDALVTSEITSVSDNVKRAAAYEAEMLYIQGGLEALGGLAMSGGGVSERVGDYSVSGTGKSGSLKSMGGIPVSPLSVALLRQDGLTRRC